MIKYWFVEYLYCDGDTVHLEEFDSIEEMKDWQSCHSDLIKIINYGERTTQF